jgi:phosphohistidine phosphatase
MPRLVKRGFAPEVIATSPYLRCRQTAETIAEHVEGEPEIVELPALAPHSDLAAIMRWTREQDVEQMAWVGHSPDIGFLAATLLGNCSAIARFAPGTCAAVLISQGAAEGAGQLHWLVAG